jgi:hypothetical protein
LLIMVFNSAFRISLLMSELALWGRRLPERSEKIDWKDISL